MKKFLCIALVLNCLLFTLVTCEVAVQDESQLNKNFELLQSEKVHIQHRAKSQEQSNSNSQEASSAKISIDSSSASSAKIQSSTDTASSAKVQSSTDNASSAKIKSSTDNASSAKIKTSTDNASSAKIKTSTDNASSAKIKADGQVQSAEQLKSESKSAEQLKDSQVQSAETLKPVNAKSAEKLSDEKKKAQSAKPYKEQKPPKKEIPADDVQSGYLGDDKYSSKFYTTYKDKESPYILDIEKEYVQNPNITEYGFSFWIKYSFFKPILCNVNRMYSYYSPIAGLSTLKTSASPTGDYCDGNQRFMSLQLYPLSQNHPHFHITGSSSVKGSSSNLPQRSTSTDVSEVNRKINDTIAQDRCYWLIGCLIKEAVKKTASFLQKTEKQADESLIYENDISLVQTKSIKTYTTTSSTYGMSFPHYNDLDNEWIFVSFVHSMDKKKSKFFAHFEGSGQSRIVQFNSQTMKKPDTLIFRAGSCKKNYQYAWNGQYQKVRIFYGKTDTVYTEKINIYQKLATLTKPIIEKSIYGKVNPLTTGIITSKISDTKFRNYDFPKVYAPKEYAVWGWAKYIPQSKGISQQTIVQVSMFPVGQISGESRIGDLSLMVYTTSSNVCFRYQYYYYNYKNRNIDQKCYGHGQSIDNWFFVYIGYNHDTYQVTGYVKFDEKTAIHFVKGGRRQPRAEEFTVLLGKSSFWQPFNGQYKDWYFGIGENTFLKDKSEIEKLEKQAKFDEDADFTLKEGPGKPGYEELKGKDSKQTKITVPEKDLSQVRDVSISFWYRWSFLEPDYVYDNNYIRSKYPGLFFITEDTDTKPNKCTTPILSAMYAHFNFGNIASYYYTYDLNQQGGVSKKPYGWYTNHYHNNIDGAWNWMYMGYGYHDQDLTVYHYYSRNNKVVYKKFTNINHNYPPKNLALILGEACNPSSIKFNGLYYNIRFNYLGRSYLNSQNLIKQYLEKRVTKPTIFVPPTKTEIKVLLDQDIDDTIETSKQKIVEIKEASGVSEFAISGWVKRSFRSQGWNGCQNIYQVFENPKSGYVGDQKLHAYICKNIGGGNYLRFTFDHEVWSSSASITTASWDANGSDDMDSWFWIYHAYNYDTKKVLMYVRWYGNRIEKKEYSGYWQVIPQKLKVAFGSYFGYQGFNGHLKDFKLYYGPGAYMTDGFPNLYAPLPDQLDGSKEEAQKDPYTSDPQEYIQDFTHNNPLYTKEYTKKDFGDKLQEFSVSMWFKFSFLNPKSFGIYRAKKTNINQMMSLFSLSEKNDQHYKYNQYTKFTGRFYQYASHPHVYFDTYCINRNSHQSYGQWYDWKNMDDQWVWIYAGYDYRTQQLIGTMIWYQNNGQEIQRVYKIDQCALNQHPDKLYFSLGGKYSHQYPLNGRFYDVRVRFDDRSYKYDDKLTKQYFKNYIPNPPNYDDYNKFTMIKAKTLMNTQTKHYYVTLDPEFGGSKQWAVHGWFRYQNNNKNTGQALMGLYHQYDNNAGYEDAPMIIYIYYNTIRRYISTLPNEGLNQYRWQNHDDANDYGMFYQTYSDIGSCDLTQWFFLYSGYDYDQQSQYTFALCSNNQVLSNTMSQVMHYIPKTLQLKVFQDFKGYIKDLEIEVGPNTFRNNKTKILEISGKYEDADKGDDDDVLIVPPKIIKSEMEKDVDYFEHITASVWVRWQYKMPIDLVDPKQVLDKCYYFAKLEQGTNGNVKVEYCFENNGNPFIKFTESFKKQSARSNIIKFPGSQYVDARWLWIYISHNYKTSQTDIGVYFKQTNDLQIATFSKSDYWEKSGLVWNVGDPNKKFNGFFFDDDFYWDGPAHEYKKDEIEAYRKKITLEPPTIRDPQLDKQYYIIPVRNKTTNGMQIETYGFTKPFLQKVEGFANAREYAVFGFAKWKKDIAAEDKKYVIYRVAQNTPDNIGDATNPGDVTFTLSYNPKKQTLYFGSYHFDFKKGKNIFERTFEKVSIDMVTEWFYFYQGYSRILQQFYIYLEFDQSKVYGDLITQPLHLASQYYGIYLGKSVSNEETWQGYFMNTGMAFGYGAFKTNPQGAKEFQAAINDGKFIKDPKTEEIEDDCKEGEVCKTVKVEQPHPAPPKGDCVILYSECFFQGEYKTACDVLPDIEIKVKSIYIPKGQSATLYNMEYFNGKTAKFSQTVPCLDFVKFSLLQESGIKLLDHSGKGIFIYKSKLQKLRKQQTLM